jgi:hypothetical protein
MKSSTISCYHTAKPFHSPYQKGTQKEQFEKGSWSEINRELQETWIFPPNDGILKQNGCRRLSQSREVKQKILFANPLRHFLPNFDEFSSLSSFQKRSKFTSHPFPKGDDRFEKQEIRRFFSSSSRKTEPRCICRALARGSSTLIAAKIVFE